MAKKINLKFNGSFDGAEVNRALKKIKMDIESISLSDSILKDLKEKNSEITKTIKQITKFNFSSRDYKGYESLTSTLDSQIKEFKRTLESIGKTDVKIDINSEELTEGRQKISELKEELTALSRATEGGISSILSSKSLPKELKSSISSVEQLRQKIAQLQAESSGKNIADFFSEKDTAKFGDLLNNIDTAKKKIVELQNLIKSAESMSNTQKTQFAKDAGFANFGDIRKQLSYYESAVHTYEKAEKSLDGYNKKTKEHISVLKESEKEYTDQQEQMRGLQSQIDNLEKEMADLSNTLEDLGFKQIKKEIDDLQPSFNILDNGLDNLNKDSTNFRQEVSNAMTQDLANSIEGLATRYLGVSEMFDFAARKTKEALDTYRNIDSQVTGIAMVTNQTLEASWKEVTSYTDLARKLGATTADIAKQSEEFYRQGLNQADTMKMIEATTTMASIANMDYVEAINYMTSAVNGFKLESEDAMRVSDIFSKLDASAATSVEDLAIALSKTASIAKNAGMELETTTAFLTKMLSVTQEAPENLGTALKIRA